MELDIEQFKKLASMNGKLASYEHLRITDSTPIPAPVPVITINNETICTEGNMTTISGASKSGKSAFTSIIIAGAISRDGIIDGLESVKVQPNFDRKAVIHFDTEQSRHKHQRNLKTILQRCSFDTCPDYFLSYNIRELELNEYADRTICICEAAFAEHGGIHLIVIDGIADYISDVNDPIQSNTIIKFFLDLATRHSTPILAIVHTNPGGDKERGHLGSQCQRKSESVLMVKTEGDISYLEPKLLREAGKAGIPMIQFIYNKEKGFHVGCGIRTDDATKKDTERIEAVHKICDMVFGGQESYVYGEAINAIMKATKKRNNTAKGYFTDMKAHEMIVQGEDKNWRKNRGKENESV